MARSPSGSLRCLQHLAVIDPDQVGARPAGRNQRERPLFVVELHRGPPEPAAQFQVADQRGLGEAVLAGAEIGSDAHQ